MTRARAEITAPWERERLLAQPILGSMRSQIAKLSSGELPDLAALNALTQSLCSASGAPIRFVPPLAASRSFEEHYEVRVYREGTIGTRAHNWHDLAQDQSLGQTTFANRRCGSSILRSTVAAVIGGINWRVV